MPTKDTKYTKMGRDGGTERGATADGADRADEEESGKRRKKQSDKVAEKGREHRHEKAQETHGMVERQSGEESERLAVVDVGEDTQKESGGDHGQVSCLWKIGE